MTRFIQLHALTVYAPSNLNRDDTGRPKTAKFGGVERLRISSQALKRAIRTSKTFESHFKEENLGIRTAQAGEKVFRQSLLDQNVEPRKAFEIAKVLSSLIGKLDDQKPDFAYNKEMFFMSHQEKSRFINLAKEIAQDNELAQELIKAAAHIDGDDSELDEPKKKKKEKGGLSDEKKKELRKKLLLNDDTAIDIAMFGRMVASAPQYNREAAVQVAHAITTHRVDVEDDYFTAVDMLKEPWENVGAQHIGELGFGSGVFYLYACIDRDQLERNLGGDAALTKKAIEAFVEGFASVSPSGKQNSFAAHGRANYLRVEKGSQQPRSLAAAFFEPVRGENLLHDSVNALDGSEGLIAQMNSAYGNCFDADYEMRCIPGAPIQGSLAEAIAFAAE